MSASDGAGVSTGRAALDGADANAAAAALQLLVFFLGRAAAPRLAVALA
jgi:hypothetical protein